MQTKIFDLSLEIRALQSQFDNEELTDEDIEREIQDVIFAKQDQRDLILQELALLSREELAAGEVIEKEIDRLQAMAKRRKSAADNLKKTIMAAMELAEVTKIRGELVTLSIQKNGGRDPLDIDVAKLPDSFIQIKREADSAKIREALEKKAAIPGVTVLPRGQHLRIA